jgi:hypothetical protein
VTHVFSRFYSEVENEAGSRRILQRRYTHSRRAKRAVVESLHAGL